MGKQQAGMVTWMWGVAALLEEKHVSHQTLGGGGCHKAVLSMTSNLTATSEANKLRRGGRSKA